MSTTRRLAAIAESPEMAIRHLIDGYRSFERRKPVTYWAAEICESRYLPPIDVTADTARLKAQSRISWSYWFDHEPRRESQWDDLSSLVYKIGAVVKYAPAVIERTCDVGSGGETYAHTTILQSSEWLERGMDKVYLRFSEAFTSRHPLGSLRTPIQGKGIALEITDRPDSVDPRDAVTLFIFQPEWEEDARFPWIEPHDAKVFDVRSFESSPASVWGFGDEVTDAEELAVIKVALRELITQIMLPNRK